MPHDYSLQEDVEGLVGVTSEDEVDQSRVTPEDVLSWRDSIPPLMSDGQAKQEYLAYLSKAALTDPEAARQGYIFYLSERSLTDTDEAKQDYLAALSMLSLIDTKVPDANTQFASTNIEIAKAKWGETFAKAFASSKDDARKICNDMLKEPDLHLFYHVNCHVMLAELADTPPEALLFYETAQKVWMELAKSKEAASKGAVREEIFDLGQKVVHARLDCSESIKSLKRPCPTPATTKSVKRKCKGKKPL